MNAPAALGSLLLLLLLLLAPVASAQVRDLTRVGRCYQLETGPWTISPLAQSAEERQVPPMPYLVRLDSSDAGGFFKGTVWRLLVAHYDSTVHRRRDEWMWHSDRGRLRLSTNSVFGGVSIEFPVAGAEMRGRAEVWTDYTGAYLPAAPVRARATACPRDR